MMYIQLCLVNMHKTGIIMVKFAYSWRILHHVIIDLYSPRAESATFLFATMLSMDTESPIHVPRRA